MAWPALQLGGWRGAAICLQLHLTVCQKRVDLCSQEAGWGGQITLASSPAPAYEGEAVSTGRRWASAAACTLGRH